MPSLNVHLIGTFLAQLAEEDSEIVSDEQEDKQDAGEDKRETKEVQTGEVKTQKVLQKTPKRIRTIPCKVMLLDGTEYSCDLEVSMPPEDSCRMESCRNSILKLP